MTLGSVVLMAALVGGVLWLGQRVPLSGRRKSLVTACRTAAIVVLCSALWGAPRPRLQMAPRQVAYLVDGSASIDAEQQAWMARRIASLEALRPKAIERTVILFGGTAAQVIPLGRERLTDPAALQRVFAQASIPRQQTNLEAAVLQALGALEPHRRAGVVLLSDGRETAGNVGGLLAYARRAGFALFPSPPPMLHRAAATWEQLVVPPTVRQGAPVPIQLVLFSGAPRSLPGQVTVSVSGVSIKRQRVTVRPGWQVCTVSLPAVGRGTMALEVGLEIPGQGVAERRRAYTEVEGPPQVLLVAEQAAALPALGAALKRREMTVEVARLRDLPANASQLLDNEAVILFNVPKSALTAEQAGALRTYVETYGGGLLTVGLGGDWATELTTPAPLDALLPVSFQPKGLQEAKRRVCMVMLIDRSASMMGPRIAATKRAAIELVKQLASEDLVGILAFDTQPYVVVEVQPAGQVSDWVVEKLVQLRSSGGTDIYPALAAGANRLDMTGATVKHLILLSDGNTPVNEKAYQALLEDFRRTNVTISTIGIGAAFINTDYLQWLAASTGGTFYSMRTLNELPQIIARDTHQALGRLPFTEGYFRPAKTPQTEWFADRQDFPPVRGYFTASAKPGTRVDLTVNGGGGDDPLLARWSMGQGRVASFLSDADVRWSPDWIRWPGFEGTWAQIVRWTLRRQLLEDVFVRVEEHDGRSLLIVEGELDNPHGTLVAADGAVSIPLPLIQTAPWRWYAPLEQTPSGWYQVVLESRAGPVAEGTALFAKRWVQLGTLPVSQERPGQPPQETLLRQLARATDGLYDAPDAALLPPTTTAPVTAHPSAWWLPLVILLLLAEIALRGSSML